ncbi:hypothetical protein C8N43_0154 [Litoreibacter ponti]|uniref:Lipoprotein n=1 Tax=Litoreibacter ponti TaxID=1510457 RepID=A0A2T6BHH7_9RHOB|nr:hypothetical protein [Litoreibacter ponti]PTX55515.1 hypothetical protein C8N43_0154 [Litoreibacter ponti]
MKRLAALCAALLLTACAPPPGETLTVRPGIGSDVDLDAIRPPSGVTYRFDLINDGLPIPTDMRLTSRKRGATSYTYAGQMILTLPDARNLEQITAILSEAIGEAPISARGNQLFIPIGLKADNRFRATSSSITGDTTRYAPNDCFAVLGTCRYKAIDRAGRAASLVTETTEEGGIWRSRTKLDPREKNPGLVNETRRAIYSIDKNAVLLDMVVLRGSGGQRSRFAIKRK